MYNIVQLFVVNLHNYKLGTEFMNEHNVSMLH